jgi:hypothetical protein
MSKETKHTSKKRKMIAATAFLLGVFALSGGALTYAETNAPLESDSRNTLVTAIAQKFNLTPSDVQAVVDQVMTAEHTQMQANHQELLANRIKKAVTDGTLTQAKADLIIAKQKEIQTDQENLKGKTQVERQTARIAQQALLKQWAVDNAIPAQFTFGAGMGGHKEMHGARHQFQK